MKKDSWWKESNKSGKDAPTTQAANNTTEPPIIGMLTMRPKRKIRIISFFLELIGFDFRRCGNFFERFDFLVCSKFNHTQCGRACACAVACLPHRIPIRIFLGP